MTKLTEIEDEVSCCLDHADQFMEALPTEIEETASREHIKDLLSLRDNISELRAIVLDDQDEAEIALPTFRFVLDHINNDIHAMKEDLCHLTREERKNWKKVDSTIRESRELSEIEELVEGISSWTTDFGAGRNAEAMWKALGIMCQVERYTHFMRHARKLQESLQAFIEFVEKEHIDMR